MTISLRLLPAVSAILTCLGGCAPSDTDPGPGGVSVGEAKALDEAAELLDQRRLPETAVPDTDGQQAPLPPEVPRNPDDPSIPDATD